MTQQIPRSLMAHACLPLIFAVSSVFLLESRWNLVSDRNENLPRRCERRMQLTWPASNEGCDSAHQNSIDMVCSFACLLICERIDYWMSCSSISQHEIWTSLSWRRLIVCNLSLLLLLRYYLHSSDYYYWLQQYDLVSLKISIAIVKAVPIAVD